MLWEDTTSGGIPIKSWCKQVDSKALTQAENLAIHPATVGHVALMPDCHVGYGMPIGGVIACDNAVIPNAVGVDIGCGVGAIQTSLAYKDIEEVMSSQKELVRPCVKLQPLGVVKG